MISGQAATDLGRHDLVADSDSVDSSFHCAARFDDDLVRVAVANLMRHDRWVKFVRKLHLVRLQ